MKVVPYRDTMFSFGGGGWSNTSSSNSSIEPSSNERIA